MHKETPNQRFTFQILQPELLEDRALARVACSKKQQLGDARAFNLSWSDVSSHVVLCQASSRPIFDVRIRGSTIGTGVTSVTVDNTTRQDLLFLTHDDALRHVTPQGLVTRCAIVYLLICLHKVRIKVF